MFNSFIYKFSSHINESINIFISSSYIENKKKFIDKKINSAPGIILNTIIELFGEKKVLYRSPKGSRYKYTLDRHLRMSIKDWQELKNKIKKTQQNFKWPAKYTVMIDKKWNDKDINYTKILSDIFTGSWYYDDVDLVQGARTIVRVSENMTFKELIDKVFENKLDDES